MALDQELRRIAEVAVTYCRDGEELAGIVPAEPSVGVRLYVCAYRDGEETSWLVLTADGSPVGDRSLIRDADAQHRGGADRGRAAAGERDRRSGRAGGCAPRRHACPLPRSRGAGVSSAAGLHARGLRGAAPTPAADPA